MSSALRLALLACLVMLTIGCDRVTKHVVTQAMAAGGELTYWGGAVRVLYVENAGGFLSLGAGLPAALRTALFIVGTGVMLAGVVAVAVRQRWQGLALVGATLFVAGGASNWIDRLARGSVVDFLNVGIGPIRTGIFNVADVAIMVGAVLVVAGLSRTATGLVPQEPPR